MKSKRGSLSSIIFISIALLLIGIGLFTFAFVYSKISVGFLANPMINQSDDAKNSIAQGQSFTSKYDYIFLCVFIGLALGIIVTGYLIGGIAIYAIVYYIGLGVTIVASAIFSNIWEVYTTSSMFGSLINSYPIMNHIMTYLPYYTLIIGALGCLAMYAKPYFQQQYPSA